MGSPTPKAGLAPWQNLPGRPDPVDPGRKKDAPASAVASFTYSSLYINTETTEQNEQFSPEAPRSPQSRINKGFTGLKNFSFGENLREKLRKILYTIQKNTIRNEIRTKKLPRRGKAPGDQKPG